MDRDEEPVGNLLDWVTDFDNPEVAEPRDRPSASRPGRFASRLARSNPVIVPMLAGAGGLAVVAAIVLAVLARPVEEDAGTVQPAAEDAAPRPTLTLPSPTPDPVGSGRLPETCADAFSSDMKRALAQSGLEVNSVWTGSRNLPPGSADTELVTLLAGDDRLDCFWLDEFGGEGSAMLTVLADTTEATTQDAMARLAELGLTRRDENGGGPLFRRIDRRVWRAARGVPLLSRGPLVCDPMVRGRTVRLHRRHGANAVRLEQVLAPSTRRIANCLSLIT